MNLPNSKLALFGGSPIRQKPWPSYDSGFAIWHFSRKERNALKAVLKSKLLTRYDTSRLVADTASVNLSNT